jgi:hypothetical protein
MLDNVTVGKEKTFYDSVLIQKGEMNDGRSKKEWRKVDWGDGMRITYTEVGDDGIDVGERDPTRRPRC